MSDETKGFMTFCGCACGVLCVLIVSISISCFYAEINRHEEQKIAMEKGYIQKLVKSDCKCEYTKIWVKENE